MNSVRRLLLWCVTSIALGSCGVKPLGLDSDLSRAVIPGTIANRLELGQAHDSDRANWGNLACVTGDVTQEDTGSSAQLDFTRDMSYEQTLKSIAGELGVGVNFPTVAVEAKADYASSNSASEFRENYTLSYRYATKQKFKIGSIRLTDKGRYYSQNIGLLRDRCKNEFVDQIDYGAMFLATLSIEFKNKEDKEKFGGSLKVDVLGGIVKVEGKLALATDEQKKNIKIRLVGMQEGGDPRQLTKVINPNVAACDAVNLAPCIEAFRSLLTYGSSLHEQLTGPSVYSVLSYRTESYQDTGIEELVARDIPFIRSEVISTREEIEAALRMTRTDLSRAAMLLSSFGELLSSTQLEALATLREDLQANKYEQIRALQYCYDNPYAGTNAQGQLSIPCLDNYTLTKANKIKKVNRAILEIKFTVNDLNETLCKAARIFALRDGLLTDKEFDVYNKINYAPEYAVSHDRKSGLTGWGECLSLVNQL